MINKISLLKHTFQPKIYILVLLNLSKQGNFKYIILFELKPEYIHIFCNLLSKHDTSNTCPVKEKSNLVKQIRTLSK